VQELREVMASGRPHSVLDARAADSRAREGWIEGSLPVSEIAQMSAPQDAEVILYCNCPNEASAALFALQLRRRGFKRVRPLAGGLDAWMAAGFPVIRGPQ
jgi:rhodanese-related sulfurtransferase